MTANENITLVDNNNLTSSYIEIAEKLNIVFSNAVKELNIKINPNKAGPFEGSFFWGRVNLKPPISPPFIFQEGLI